jgi:hypothetical protein
VTPNLSLPVPGDDDPADYVTDTGALADRIDLISAPRLTIANSLPSQRNDGDEVLYQPSLTLSAGTAVAADTLLWRLRWMAGPARWSVIGGSPFVGSLPDVGNVTPAGSYLPMGPTMTGLTPGDYIGSLSVQFNAGAAGQQLGLALGLNPAGTWAPQSPSGLTTAPAAGPYNLLLLDVPFTWPGSGVTAVGMMAYVSSGTATVQARRMKIRPLRLA